MRKLLLSFFAALAAFNINAQVVASFESLTLPKADTFYLNYSSPGADVGFSDNSIYFQCVFDTVFGGVWSGGFSYSNMTDSVTSGYMNQYAAKTAGGYNASSNYVVYWQGYSFTPKVIIPGTAAVKQATGFYITNSTYAFNSMRDGDMAAKKFGGLSGNDPDWFKVVIRGYYNGQLKTDSVEVYLADFRDANNSNDYILKDWQWVDLTSLGNVDSLKFDLSSSDNHVQFGMNTPAYFCMDNFTAQISTDVPAVPQYAARVYPNPAKDKLFIELKDNSTASILLLDMSGKILGSYGTAERFITVPTASLSTGTYLLQFDNGHQKQSLRFIKQ